jgi:hypothetical protein
MYLLETINNKVPFDTLTVALRVAKGASRHTRSYITVSSQLGTCYAFQHGLFAIASKGFVALKINPIWQEGR